MRNPISDLRLRWRLHETHRPLVVDGEAVAPPKTSLLDSVRHARAVQIELASDWSDRRGARPSSGRLSALRYRLNDVGPEIIPGWRAEDHHGVPTVGVLKELALRVRDREEQPLYWLFYIAASGAFPTEDSLLAFMRALRVCDDGELVPTIIDHATREMERSHSHYRHIQLHTGTTIADVDFCATHSFNSGIQRVVRNLLEQWEGAHECTLVAWDHFGTGMRPLSVKETKRVLAWGRPDIAATKDSSPDVRTLIVPWRSVVLMPETSAHRTAPRQAALAQYSGNVTVAIAYDTIPLTSGSFVTTDESLVFAGYLDMVKRVDLLLPISETAAEEFRGFRDALAARGKQGPAIEAVPLPEAAVAAAGVGVGVEPSEVPIVLSVGSFEGRKNQLAVVDAAELLWRKGLSFQLVMVGGSAQKWYKDVDHRIADLILSGRPISRLLKVSERALASSYQAARFSVFASLHEGYGLPVAESLASGTPVVATSYGSVGDIARQGGCLLVDPRDIDSIADAMERLLTDDGALAELEAQIPQRPKRSWADYAADVWNEIEKARRSR